MTKKIPLPNTVKLITHLSYLLPICKPSTTSTSRIKKSWCASDFNVPTDDNGQVTDNTRIEGAKKTIRKILDDGGAVVLMAHFGRPKGKVNKKYSLEPIVPAVEEVLGVKVHFVGDCVGEEAQQAVEKLKVGEVLLLENLRFHPEEEKGEEKFAKQLADLGADVYVNDAFGAAHRAHASIATIVPLFPADSRMFGYLMESELKNADKLLGEVKRPFTAILGGAKVSDKILLIEHLLDRVDQIIIGGGMAYTFFKAQGGNIGKSLVEDDRIEVAKELLKKAKEKGVELLLPQDSIIADKFANDADHQPADSTAIPDGWMGLDIGPESRKQFAEAIRHSKTIFWNGPMGVFEMDNFQHGTRAIAEAVAEATKENGAYSLVGGGDSVAAVQQFELADDVSYVSTGGGAMLELLEGKDLPGVAAMK